VAAAVVGMGAVYMREEQHAASTTRVRIRDIGRVFQRLATSGVDGTLAVFLFGANGPSKPKTDELTVQFSIENGRPGLDWVLEDPPNIAAKDRVIARVSRTWISRPMIGTWRPNAKFLVFFIRSPITDILRTAPCRASARDTARASGDR
jgi:hypothetical protein